MKVFNLYLKMLRKNLTTIVIYVVVFTFFAIVLTGSSSTPATSYEGVKVPIAWINNDEESSLIVNLKDYLTDYVIFVEVEEKNIPDALYFREIYMVITIPNNFTEAYFNRQPVKLSYEQIPDAITSVTIERAVNNYLKYILIYEEHLQTEDIESIYVLVKENLSKEITAQRTKAFSIEFAWVNTYYNILSYLIIVINISVIGIVMTKLREFDLKSRMTVSPYSQTRTNLELLLGNLVFTILFTSLMVGLSYILYPNGMKEFSAFLYVINVFAFSLATLCAAYFISLLAKKAHVVSAATNVISLGSSFLSGAFVPQVFLSSGVLAFAHLLPNYYYINNNDTIASLSNLSFDSLRKYLLFLGVQILFSVVFIILSIVISIKQSRSEQ